MANIYVRSTDGNDADNGSTWALAKATLAGAAAIDAAGDTIYVSQSHAESTASGLTITLAGTGASPTRIICGDDAAEPPTSLSTAAQVTTTGNSSITIAATAAYIHGIRWFVGTGVNTPQFIGTNVSDSKVEYVNNQIYLNTTASGSRLTPSSGTGALAIFTNVGVRFSAVGHGFSLLTLTSFVWRGGSILSGGTAPTTLMVSPARKATAVITGVDLSNGGTSMNLSATATAYSIKWINCKLPASWNGLLVTGTLNLAERHEMYNCDSVDTNYRLWIEDYNGSIKSETTIVRSGGAKDGTTSLSWKMASSANAEYLLFTLDSPEIVIWNDTTGSSKTVTVEVVTDNVTLTDGECWLEVQYLGTSGFPLGSFISDAKADVLATAANQTSSTAVWTTTGLATPVRQKLSVTFTPQEKGFIHAVVKLAKASTTVYACPKPIVT